MNIDDELHLVSLAFLRLEEENPMWKSNKHLFFSYSRQARWAWWLRVKELSTDSRVPMYKTFVQKVIQLRLER